MEQENIKHEDKGRTSSCFKNTPTFDECKKLAEILSPIHDATPLEKAYFMRMVQFVEAEHVMAKMGSNGKENSGFSTLLPLAHLT